MPKQQYHGKDFFQRQEFRGLFLADHQEALGQKAFKCVDALNNSTVSQFNSINTFKDSITSRKTQENFYKTNTTLKSFMRTSYKSDGRHTAQESIKDIRLEGAIDTQDHHYTLEKEREKMARTFQPKAENGGKFLP